MDVTLGIVTLVRAVQPWNAVLDTVVPFISTWPLFSYASLQVGSWVAFAECKMNKKNKITFMV